MIVTKLKLINFRNYHALELRPAPGVNVIFGRNGQGKTNVAEAVFFCALGRSHRTTKDAELIMHDTPGAYVGCDIAMEGATRKVEIKVPAGERKAVLVDGSRVKRIGELMGVMNAVMFSPEDLSLVKQGPAERRRFMDMELSQLQPSYFYALQQYNAALRQRNALLKEMPPGGMAMLAMWDEQLASTGEGIISARTGFMDEISTIARDIHRNVAGRSEELFISYRPNVPIDTPASIRDTLYSMLERSAEEDARRGFTTVGPHRDDIAMELNGSDVRVYGSQGQQRTAALALKLSEIALMRGRTGEPPVLLLDDVFSELDEARQAALVGAIAGTQSFITCTALSGIEKAGLHGMNIYECKDGTLKGYTDNE